MSSSFGDVQYAEPEQATGSSPAGADAPVDSFDLNDPRLTSENIEINPEGDAFAAPPPLPDGKWRAKLKQQDVKDGKGGTTRYAPKTTKDGKLYLYTALEASVIDHSGKQDGLRVTDYFVSTMVRRDGSTAASTILHRLGKPAPARSTHRELMELLVKALAGEPELGIETAWEWSCETCGKEAKAAGVYAPRAIQGAHKMPRDAKGNPNPEMLCPVNKAHGFSVARPRIVSYLALADLPK